MHLFRSKPTKEPAVSPAATGNDAKSGAVPKASSSGDPQPSDRRVFARVRSECRVSFQAIDRNDHPTGSRMEATTYDISGGGLLILMDHREHSLEGRLLELDLYLPKTEPIHARGTVLRHKPSGTSRDRSEMVVEFSDIRELDRNVILRYVFAQQSERRRLGLL